MELGSIPSLRSERLVPDSRKHRGPGPQDRVWFDGGVRPTLLAAVSDLSWLLSRGYAGPSSLKLVGDRYRLVERQRIALARSACSDRALAGRRARCVGLDAIRGQPVRIDAFNLILTLESALGGALVLGCRDGCYRDLAGMHGTYRRVDETAPALELAARWLNQWGAGPCLWLLDAPVSNSGRLAALIRSVDPTWQAEVVPDPDPLLKTPGAAVASADAGILDHAQAWVNLARAIVQAGVPDAFILDLGSAPVAADPPPD